MLTGCSAAEKQALLANSQLITDMNTALGPADAQKAASTLGDSLQNRIAGLTGQAPNTWFDAITEVPQAERDAVLRETASMEAIRRGIGSPYDYWKAQLLLTYGSVAGIPAPASTLYTALSGKPGFETIRRRIGDVPDGDFPTIKNLVGFREYLEPLVTSAQWLILRRMLDQGMLDTQADVDRSVAETMWRMAPGAAPGDPFTEYHFTAGGKIDVTYLRDKLQCDVRVALTTASEDKGAETGLANAKTVWKANIENEWANKFRVTNGIRTLPLDFHCIWDPGGPNHVTVHSGDPVWPTLNAANWFVPDPVNAPTKTQYVTDAPLHEFGHLVGNADEYDVPSTHYGTVVGPNPAGDVASGTSTVTTDPTGAKSYTVQWNKSIMGPTGPVPGPVLQRHVQWFLTWLNDHRRTRDDGTPAEPAFTFTP
jgi:hypothetical protein